MEGSDTFLCAYMILYVININSKIRWWVGGGGAQEPAVPPPPPDPYGSAIDMVVNVHILNITGKAKVH